MALKHKLDFDYSDNTDRRPKTKRLQTDWSAVPARLEQQQQNKHPQTLSEDCQQKTVVTGTIDKCALHAVPGRPYVHADHGSTSSANESVTSLWQLFERTDNSNDTRKRLERLAGRTVKTKNGVNLGDLQERLQESLKGKVRSIEEYIRLLKNRQPEQVESMSVITKQLPTKPAVELVASEQFANHAERLFDKLDVRDSDYLTRSDLARALQDPSIKGRDAQVLAAIYGQYDKLAKSAEDLGILTKKDLREYGALEVQYRKECDMSNKIAARASAPDESFIRMMGLRSGAYVTKQELRCIEQNEPMRLSDRELVSWMIDHFDFITNAHGDRYSFATHGINTDDLLDYSGKVRHSDRYKVVNEINFLLRRTNNSQNASCDRLYADMSNPLLSITPDAIKQGMIGDCYFEAAVASVAHLKPETIAKMIRVNIDGSFTVRFPGASNEPVMVSAPTEAERGLYNNGSPYGTWASVLEKANGLYAQQHFWRRNPFGNLFGGETPAEGGDGGGLGNGLALMTGNEVDMHLLALEDSQSLRSCLNDALNSTSKKSVITFTGPDMPMMRDTPGHFTRSHVYTILAFDPAGPNGGTITIRNPWGHPERTTAGTTDISFAQYQDNFCGFFSER
jgi:hypothetical protein